MGFRTVLIINNDLVHTINGDLEFGKKVYSAVSEMSLPKEFRKNPSPVIYAVNQSHADMDVLLHLTSFSGEEMASTHYSNEDAKLDLLKKMADKLGYSVSKKRCK